MNMDFDTEKFIIQIQNQPAIWNTKCADYSDRNLKQAAWEQIVNAYGAGVSTDEKKNLGETLQKKWRNIRDCFVKAHKAKTTMSGSAAKKKIPYVFYNSLLFLKDTISINSTTSKVTVKSEEANNDDAGLAANVSWTPKHKAKKHDDNGKELIGKLKSNVANETCEDDGDRLFFLSLVKEFRKIPDHLQLQTKLDLLKVIKDAQCPEYPHESWDYAKPNKPHRGYQTAHHSRTKPYFLPMQSHEIRRSPTQEPEVQILEIFSSEDSSAS